MTCPHCKQVVNHKPKLLRIGKHKGMYSTVCKRCNITFYVTEEEAKTYDPVAAKSRGFGVRIADKTKNRAPCPRCGGRVHVIGHSGKVVKHRRFGCVECGHTWIDEETYGEGEKDDYGLRPFYGNNIKALCEGLKWSTRELTNLKKVIEARNDGKI